MTVRSVIEKFRFVSNPSHLDFGSLSKLLDDVGMAAREHNLMERAVAASTQVIAVYDVEDALVGFGRLISDEVYYGTLWDIAVHPSCQKLGIGQEIVARLLATCKEQGLRMTGLFTASHNREFYQRMGFEILEDVHAMTLDIAQFGH